MKLALQDLQWETCIIYIDGIIVFAQNMGVHLRRVEQVLSRLKEAELKVKLEKCDMLQKEVTFLGHVVSAHGVKPSATNIDKIVKWPVPKTLTQVNQFVTMPGLFEILQRKRGRW